MDGDVLDDPASRALYSADASNYRHVPRVVVRPRTTDAVVTAVGLAAEHRVPITSRGTGTSIAGNACGTGLVIDFSRYLNAIEVDGDRATVQPGAVLDRVNSQAGDYVFGPDPSTHSRCTIGGMIGNNACGAHSVKWGKTSENVANLHVLTADGRTFETANPPEFALPSFDPEWFPRLSRRVSWDKALRCLSSPVAASTMISRTGCSSSGKGIDRRSFNTLRPSSRTPSSARAWGTATCGAITM